MKKGDVCILAALLLFSAIWFAPSVFLQKAETAAEVWMDGAVADRIVLSDLAQPVTRTYGACSITFSSDGAAFSASDCPDKLCVRHGKLTHAGDVMACVPNGVTLRLTATASFDAVSY